jgi:dTDP-4-amino-4,6-dideoxygalactose transaminase
MERMAWLDEFTTRRQAIATKFWDGISNKSIRPLAKPSQDQNHVNHLFVVLCPRRDELAVFLKQCGIESLVHYPIPVHMQKPCEHFQRDPHGLVAAESHARHCLSIPCHPQISAQNVQSILEAVNGFT